MSTPRQQCSDWLVLLGSQLFGPGSYITLLAELTIINIAASKFASKRTELCSSSLPDSDAIKSDLFSYCR